MSFNVNEEEVHCGVATDAYTSPANEGIILRDCFGNDNDNINDDNAGQTICVKGTIRVNNNYNFKNCKFLMHPGATLIVENGNLLDITTSQLVGCDQMWRGIEIEKGGRLYMQDNLIADAQYAVYARPDEVLITEVVLVDNIFKNNFVGLYIPDKGKLKHAVSENKFINESVLKTPFTGQTALPENLPEQNEKSLAGIFFRKISDGFSLTNNTFINLTSGALGHFSNFTAYGNSFLNIQDDAELYPDFAGNRGVSLSSAGIGNTTLLAQNNYFANCSIGIKAHHAKLTATGNTLIDTREGIGALMANAGGVTIGGAGDDKNTVTNAFIGVVVWNADPTGQVSITNNTITSNNTIGGVGVWMLFNDAPSFISENVIDVNGTGIGIQLSSVNNHTLDQNTINLNNAALNKSGIRLEDVGNSLLRDNTITGVDVTGDNNIGISVNSSPDNVYCCNEVKNTRIGVRFWGPCMSTDDFRGTTFGNHETALLLSDSDEGDGFAQTHLGTQTHTENRWIGTLTGISEARWIDGQFDAQSSRFFVDENANPDFKPNMASPANWFDSDDNEGLMNGCAPENCVIDGFVSDSPDSKRIASGQINTGVYGSVTWELERYLYGKIANTTVTDPIIANFKSSSQNNTIGDFYTIKSDEKAMFEANNTERTQIAINLSLIDEKLEAMSNIDVLLLNATPAEYDNLMLNKQQLANEIQLLSANNITLSQTVILNRTSIAASIGMVNDDIIATQVYEQNQKTVNDLHLKFIATEMQDLPQTDIDVLQTIAMQCPLEGGNAVYRARAFLTLFNEPVNYDDVSACGKKGDKSLQKPITDFSNTTIGEALKVYPNPAKNNLTVQWKTIDFEKGKLTFFDILGKQVLQQQIESGSTIQVINLQYLQSGLYFIHVKLDNEAPLVQRVIINK